MSDEDQHISSAYHIFEAIGLSSLIAAIVGAWQFIRQLTTIATVVSDLKAHMLEHDKKLDELVKKLEHTSTVCAYHHRSSNESSSSED